ncbi:MAG: DNA-binding protein [Bacteroidales bacterium]|nr:DNA-binding protein [Bacteroidales bacterium]
MNENTPIPLTPSSQDNEIILYQPDSTVKLEVRLENETVWLTQQQIADLFGTKRPAITKHLANIYKSGELEENNTCSILEHMGNDGTQRYTTKYYNLDAILSVGYRVNSRNATLFRQWANKVLKEYLLRGYIINQRLMHMESRIDHRLSEHDNQIKELSNRMDFFVRTSLPPKEGIIYDGQIFDAYNLMCDLIRSAKNRIIVVDNYIDDSVFVQLDKRAPEVSATIFTPSISRTLRQDLERHNAQYAPIEIKTFRRAHDRFLIIDDTVYHVGASFKDLGKKLTAFSKMEIMTADEFIAYLES